MRKTESLCAENVGFKEITRSRKGELISLGELIMHYRSNYQKSYFWWFGNPACGDSTRSN